MDEQLFEGFNILNVDGKNNPVGKDELVIFNSKDKRDLVRIRNPPPVTKLLIEDIWSNDGLVVNKGENPYPSWREELYLGEKPILNNFLYKYTLMSEDDFLDLFEKLGFNKNKPTNPMNNGEKLDLLHWLYVCRKSNLNDVPRRLIKALKSSNKALDKEFVKNGIQYDGFNSRGAKIFYYATGIMIPKISNEYTSQYSEPNTFSCREIIEMWYINENRRENNITTINRRMSLGPWYFLIRYNPLSMLAVRSMINDDFSRISDEYSMGILKCIDAARNRSIIYKTLLDYEDDGVFRRNVNVLNNYPELENFSLAHYLMAQDSGLQFGDLLPYTNKELVRYYGFDSPFPRFGRSEIYQYLYTVKNRVEPQWAFTNLDDGDYSNCAFSEIEDDSKYYTVFSFGCPGNWSCYSLRTLETLFIGITERPDGTYVASPDAHMVAPHGHLQNYTWDKLVGPEILGDRFRQSDIESLYNFLRGLATRAIYLQMQDYKGDMVMLGHIQESIDMLFRKVKALTNQ